MAAAGAVAARRWLQRAAAGASVARRSIAVSSEPTPNPDSVMFYPSNRAVLGEGTKTLTFGNKYSTGDSPLAAAIFKVKGVNEVLLASHHVTVTKTAGLDWGFIQPNVELVISQFYAAGLKAVKDGVVEREVASANPAYEPGSLEAQIVELLEERVRPFVQQDGGDVEFERFDPADGIVYVRMHGACSGCPKSNVTLQHGIKNLIEHYIPEVKDVLPVEDGDEDISRPHSVETTAA
uniref:Scaffold protein Nfu/NifU N-terminal domain-containing protein n=1 Tax=Alexandrium monilatum TaxID=311494 RepID=A0A7S4V5N5_9DINO